jgi:glycogen(starch) synthase
VGKLLAKNWVMLGDDVIVTTEMQGEQTSEDYDLIRQPSAKKIVYLAKWADVVFHNQPALTHAWAPLVIGKPWVTTVHTWLPYMESDQHPRSFTKRRLLSQARLLGVSRVIVDHLSPLDAQVIANPYDDALFKCSQRGKRDIDLIFVGRLVADKGLPLLLDAIATLNAEGLHPRLVIIGDGPMRALEEGYKSGSFRECVEWVGALETGEVARWLNRAKIAVIPSSWREPFGLVALEALACGCRVVASDTGGLPEATGGHALLFRSGDVASLAQALRQALHSNSQPDCDIMNHLNRHKPDAVARHYREFFQSL